MARQKNLVRRHEILRNTFILLKKERDGKCIAANDCG